MSRPTYVVGVGASAGGLDAIERFFGAMPNDTGLAFVVVQHLSPDFPSRMAELLARHTTMPIHMSEEGLVVEANQIYLIPARINLTVEDGKLRLAKQPISDTPAYPIDIFFESLAVSLIERAIAVVLSGSGSDGAKGVGHVHASGGLVLVQDPGSSAFDGMPRSAIKSGFADVVGLPESMPSRILDYISDPAKFERGVVDYTGGETKDPDKATIFGLFQQKYGIDFGLYKESTINRRLERRVQLARLRNLSEYRELVTKDSSELDALYRDLLVEVTHFFRDPEAFEILRRDIVPNIIDKAESEVRAWVPGCATGEEAYSLAMVFHAVADEMGKSVNIKVFATDAHPGSLEVASGGVYRPEATVNLPPEFIAEYMTSAGGLFYLSRKIRGSVFLASQDLTRDAPFTRLHMVSCRNVLIYLNPEVQHKVISGFHFGLRQDGILFLGPSESVGEYQSQFKALDSHWRIFQKTGDSRINLPEYHAPALKQKIFTGAVPRFQKPVVRAHREVVSNSAVETLMKRFVPPSLLINEEQELVHSFGDAHRYLQQPEGASTLDIVQMLHINLRAAMSAALHKCINQRVRVVYQDVRLHEGDTIRTIRLSAEPVPDRAQYLVSLEEVEALPDVELVSEEAIESDAAAVERIGDLERALAHTRESLQMTVEELETSNEELQSTNEELIASNEELQSANEELHSVNEELYTVNSELERKIEQLSELQTDMELLLNASNIGSIFLDNNLSIRRFAGAIGRHFDLVKHDIGRKLRNFSHRLAVDGLADALQEVMDTGSVLERRQKDEFGKPILIKAIREMMQDGEVGVLLNVISPSIGNPFEQSLQMTSGAGYWEWPDVKSDKMWWSPACYRQLEYEPDEIEPLFTKWKSMVHPDDVGKLLDAGTNRCSFVQSGFLVVRMQARSGEYIPFEYRGLFQMAEGQPTSMTGSIDRITNQTTPTSRPA